MMHSKYKEMGRTLLETISILVVMAILIVAGLTGYDFTIKKYRQKETVKQVSELAVRYKLRPIKAENNLVPIKNVYPEAQRTDAVTMKTPDTDTGRVKLQLFENTSSFAVVVNQVLDTSCREIIENATYDMLVAGDQIDAVDATELNAYSREFLLSEAGREVVEKLCKGSDSHKIGTVGLISGENCPSTGKSFWYGGKCWNCKSIEAQDNAGNCCAKGAVDACGFCPGKCPNGGVCDDKTKLCVECTDEKQDNCTANGKVCDTKTNQCVECLNPGEQCAGETEKWCMKNHTCQECDTSDPAKHLAWNKELDICECAKPLIARGEACPNGCCVDGAICHEGICTGCWLDYNPAQPTLEGSCPADRPFCHEGVCEGCSTTPTKEGEACVPLCGCDTERGLGCEEGVCKCNLWEGKDLWNADLTKCTACTADNHEKCGEAECKLTTGECCPADKPHWDATQEKCVKCVVSEHCEATEFCKAADGSYTCEPCTGALDTNAQYLQGVAGTTDRCECTGDFRVYCGSTATKKTCVFGRNASTSCKAGCTQHPDCDENQYCSCLGTSCPAQGGKCLPCPEDRPLRPKDSPEECKPGIVCDCDLNDPTCPTSCCNDCDVVTDPEHCPVAKCCDPDKNPEICPPAEPECDPEDPEFDPTTCCQEGEKYDPITKKCVPQDCDPEDECCTQPSLCCEEGQEYNPSTKTCCVKGEKYDPVTKKCVLNCDPALDVCCANPSPCCDECEKYNPVEGCVPKCAEGTACISYNKGTNTCGESECLPVLPKDDLIRKKGTLNGKMFFIPPAESKYRMTHASADRFCAYYGMHLARVMEACLKDFQYDSGHDCPNFAAEGGQQKFTDRGHTYDLASWNTSSSGDFWLAERDGNNALRVTHSCGNNHATNVCANIYPLCTE